MFNMAGDMAAAPSVPTIIGRYPPNMGTPSHHLSFVADGCNVDVVDVDWDDTCVPASALELKQSFDSLLSFDEFASFDEGQLLCVDASAMDVCNNEDALPYVLDQVSKLESMVSDDVMAPLYLNEFELPGLASPISSIMSGPTTPFSGPTAMESSEVFAATFKTPSFFRTSILHLEAVQGLDSAPLSSPSASHGFVNTEAPLHESFHERSVHGGNQAASRLNKTEFYKSKDRLTWGKRGRGGTKLRKGPRRTTSEDMGTKSGKQPRSTTHGGTSEDTRSVYDDIRVCFRVKTENVDLDDGFVWSKYGEKTLVKFKHPRSYMECTHIRCNAVKWIQRCSDMEDYVDFLYMGKHNHPRPF